MQSSRECATFGAGRLAVKDPGHLRGGRKRRALTGGADGDDANVCVFGAHSALGSAPQCPPIATAARIKAVSLPAGPTSESPNGAPSRSASGIDT